MRQRIFTLVLLAAALLPTACSKPQYDASTPDKALDSMYTMIHDGNAGVLSTMLYIQPRDITYDDGVTEASAIQNVLDKTGDMLGRLYRVAKKLQEKFPQDVSKELETATTAANAAGAKTPEKDAPPQNSFFGGVWLAKFLVDPFGLLDEQRRRLTAEDLGDGTAAIQLDGQPVLPPVGLLMREVDGNWKIEIPIQLLQDYRPNTRHEWAVFASMMLAVENSLKDFESELDAGKFRDLRQAGERAGRILGESVVVQGIIYSYMKRNAPTPPAATQPASQPASRPT